MLEKCEGDIKNCKLCDKFNCPEKCKKDKNKINYVYFLCCTNGVQLIFWYI